MFLILILQLLIIICQLIDWLQTRYISTHSIEFWELNPILGKHPTITQVNWYFIVCIVGSIGITLAARDELRLIWQIVNLSPEIWCVTHNFRIGIKLK